MIKLVDAFKEKYSFLIGGVPDVEVGEYELKNYHIVDNEYFSKTIYLITDRGTYKTTSVAMLKSLYGLLGTFLQEQFANGETVLVEIVNTRISNGRYGVAFRVV